MIPLPSRAVKQPRKPPRRFFLQSTLTVARELIGMQLVQSQFQWNQRTSLLATAIKEAGK